MRDRSRLRSCLPQIYIQPFMENELYEDFISSVLRNFFIMETVGLSGESEIMPYMWLAMAEMGRALFLDTFETLSNNPIYKHRTQFIGNICSYL